MAETEGPGRGFEDEPGDIAHPVRAPNERGRLSPPPWTPSRQGRDERQCVVSAGIAVVSDIMPLSAGMVDVSVLVSVVVVFSADF